VQRLPPQFTRPEGSAVEARSMTRTVLLSPSVISLFLMPGLFQTYRFLWEISFGEITTEMGCKAPLTVELKEHDSLSELPTVFLCTTFVEIL
jgi:hypothetical protein